MMNKATKKALIKITVYILSITVVLGLSVHFVHVPPPLPQIKYTFTYDSVWVTIGGREYQNNSIKYHGLPGTMVLDEGFVFMGFVNPETYWAAKHTTPIVESFPNGITISALPIYVTAGPYGMMVDEYQVMNRQHDQSSEGNRIPIDNRYSTVSYNNGRKFVFA
jgi:hypothetical protein